MSKKKRVAYGKTRPPAETVRALATAELVRRTTRQVDDSFPPSSALKLRGFGTGAAAHRPSSRPRAAGRRTRRGSGQHG
jgi:hypothetical protein